MEGKPLYRTIAALGLFAHALSSLIHIFIVSGGDKGFFAILTAIAVVGGVLALKWSHGIWVSLVAALMLELATFWFIFVLPAFALSYLDFVPAFVGFVGVWAALIASILGAVRRRTPREVTAGSTKKLRIAGAAVVVLAVASTVLTVVNKETVAASETAGATTILMKDGDTFEPSTVNLKTGTAAKLLLKNEDPYAHNFMVEDGYDINETFGPGSSKIITFTPKAAGNLEWVCDFHSEMKGTFVVS